MVLSYCSSRTRASGSRSWGSVLLRLR